MAYEDQTVTELQDLLRDRDLAVSGTKDELIARLEESDNQTGEDSETAYQPKTFGGMAENTDYTTTVAGELIAWSTGPGETTYTAKNEREEQALRQSYFQPQE